MDDFRDQVKKGFNKCKLDIDTLKDENHSLKNRLSEVNEENSNLKSEIKELKSEMNELKAELKGMKIAIDYIKDFKATNQDQNNNVLNKQNNENNKLTSKTNILKTTKSEPPKAKDPYEALLAFKAKANKREILKQKLITMISENGMYLSELKFLFVDHYRYCSKATFYNYLKELELEKHIRIERDSGKNIVYASNYLQKEI